MTAVDAARAIVETVGRLRRGFADGVLVDQAQRVTQLRQLRRLLEEQEERLIQALAADLGKPPVEAYASEIGFTTSEIDHALAGLSSWMAPERIKVPLAFKPGSARVVSQPLGVVLVIAPWNFPVQLSLAPMAAALAAGNAVVLKPSELAPATSAALAELVPHYLDGRSVAVVEGGADVAQQLLAQRFDHIFFTGGREV
ncbi:MAG: aldehyde dehydrogenase family protein, partial [Ilumatobacteraceae bacterium]